MPNIIMLHRNNPAGQKLVNLLSESIKELKHKDSYIVGIPFIEISISTEDSMKRILNSEASIKNYLKRETMSQMLELSGISFGQRAGETIIKYYDVLIFDMNTISIRVRGKEGTSKYIKEADSGKVAEIARKTIYVMGLDYGMVTIALTGKRKIRVMDIFDSPELRKKDMNALVNKIILLTNQGYPRINPDNEIKLGADPEFMLFNTRSGKMIAASDFFPRDGIIGCDNIRVPNRQQRPVAEVRPNPATSPRELTDNIKSALTSANKLAPYRNVRWVAGSHPLSGYSIGGHIHFSNIIINFALLRALDNYLGIIVFLIEDPASASRRRKKYGHLADIRLKPYGGFEYRTLGSWLITPEITCAILCLAKIVAEHYFELNNVYLNNIEALQAFYQGNQEHFRPLFSKIWKEISRTTTFNDYRDELKVIPDMIENKATWDEGLDLKVTWKIESRSKRNYSANKNKNAVIANRSSARQRSNTNRSRSSRPSSSRTNSSPIHNTRIQP